MSIGQLINRQLRAADISQYELARRIGRDHASVQRYIAGARIPAEIAHKLAAALYETATERRQFLRRWKDADERVHRESDVRRRLKAAKTKARKRFYAEIDGEDNRHMTLEFRFEPAIPLIHVYKKDKALPPQMTPRPIISFSSVHGFCVPLGEHRYYEDGKLAFDDKVRRYKAYCDEQRLAYDALVELARDMIIAHPDLSGATYQREGYFLIRSEVATDWSQEIRKSLKWLTAPDTEGTHRYAARNLRRIAADLSYMRKQAGEIEKVRAALVQSVNDVSALLHRR